MSIHRVIVSATVSLQEVARTGDASSDARAAGRASPDMTGEIARAIEGQRNRVLDFEIAVDAARETLDRDLEELRAAVRERDREIEHLQQLTAWQHDDEGSSFVVPTTRQRR